MAPNGCNERGNDEDDSDQATADANVSGVPSTGTCHRRRRPSSDKSHSRPAAPPLSQEAASGDMDANGCGGGGRPLILITEPNNTTGRHKFVEHTTTSKLAKQSGPTASYNTDQQQQQRQLASADGQEQDGVDERDEFGEQVDEGQEEDQFEIVDGISYRIVAAVTRKPSKQTGRTSKRSRRHSIGRRASGSGGGGGGADQDAQQTPLPPPLTNEEDHHQDQGDKFSGSTTKQQAPTVNNRPLSKRRQTMASAGQQQVGASGGSSVALAAESRLSVVRRKSSAFVSNLSSFLVPSSRSSQELGANNDGQHESGTSEQQPARRRMSIYEMTKSPPPETSIEMYLNERRRSSTVSAKFVQQQLEQQSTFETNYQARQQYFKDLNEKLINQDKKLLNVVANRGRIHRHSVDIAQLPLNLAVGNANAARKLAAAQQQQQQQQQQREELLQSDVLREEDDELNDLFQDKQQDECSQQQQQRRRRHDDDQDQDDYNQDEQRDKSEPLGATATATTATTTRRSPVPSRTINQVSAASGELAAAAAAADRQLQQQKLSSNKQQQQQQLLQLASICEDKALSAAAEAAAAERRASIGQLNKLDKNAEYKKRELGAIIKKFQKFDLAALSSAPSPDVKIGQRVAYKEYYGNEFGTIRWIGRVPQVSSDWTVGVEFDNAIGEGDGSLHGRRYFIAKDCFAKFLPLDNVALVDQHVGRPEPGTMISVMSAAVRPGQMISIQRVSTVHVQHCFLNAPHRMPGAELFAINTRLHCQCPNCGPCAHVVKPPRTQRLRDHKNATHMCQFSTYTCCGMESSEDALCTYTGNKISSLPPPTGRSSSFGLPPIGNSWMEGSGYLTNLQAEQRKTMPEEYRFGAAPEDIINATTTTTTTTGLNRRAGSYRKHANNEQTIHSNRTASPLQQPFEVEVMASDKTTKRRLNNSSNHHHHHHHHHHNRKQHHHHHHNHLKSTGDESASSPIYTNLNGNNNNNNKNVMQFQIESTMNLASSASDKNFTVPVIHDDNKLAVVSPDSKAALSYEQQQQQQQQQQQHFQEFDLHNMKKVPPSERDLNDDGGGNYCDGNGKARGDGDGSGEDGDNGDDAHSTSKAQKSPKKLFYRDSIENRYLFPTDDIIDSTLEADLENLSQARYGYFQNSRLNGTSRNIFKSLRSLVSCLSAKSNQNSNLGSRHSETTLRFFERPTNEINKAQPMLLGKRAASSEHEHFYESSTSSGCGRKSTELAYDDFPMVKHSTNSNYETDKVEYCSATTAAAAAYNRHTRAAAAAASVPCGDFYQHYYQHQRKHDSNGGSSGFGHSFAGAGSNEATATTSTKTTTTATTRTMERRNVRRQISSSSDCGFSSASQNSINFPSYPSCSPILSLDDDQRRMNQIYKRIASRLISSSASITSEDLFKLKRTLFELHSESCCLHDNNNNSNNNNEQNLHHQQQTRHAAAAATATIEMSECEQVIADIIKRNFFENSETFNQYLNDNDNVVADKYSTGHAGAFHQAMAHETITCCQQSSDIVNCKNVSCHKSLGETLPRNCNSKDCNNNNNNNVTKMSTAHCGIKSDQQQQQQQLQKKGRDCYQEQAPLVPTLTTTERASSDKLSGEVNSSALPRAFELKLTLSINSDTNSAQSPLSNVTNQDATLDGSTVIDCESTNEQDKAGGGASSGSIVNISFISDSMNGDKANGICLDSTDVVVAPSEQQNKHRQLTNEISGAEISLAREGKGVATTATTTTTKGKLCQV